MGKLTKKLILAGLAFLLVFGVGLTTLAEGESDPCEIKNFDNHVRNNDKFPYLNDYKAHTNNSTDVSDTQISVRVNSPSPNVDIKINGKVVAEVTLTDGKYVSFTEKEGFTVDYVYVKGGNERTPDGKVMGTLYSFVGGCEESSKSGLATQGNEQDVSYYEFYFSVDPPSEELTKLRLTSLCSDDPAETRRWRVRNTNEVDVVFTWDIYGTELSGTETVEAGEDFIFDTPTQSGDNTMRIFVDGKQQDVKASSGAACEEDTDPDPEPEPSHLVFAANLDGLCDGPLTATIKNDNEAGDMEGEVKWELYFHEEYHAMDGEVIAEGTVGPLNADADYEFEYDGELKSGRYILVVYQEDGTQLLSEELTLECEVEGTTEEDEDDEKEEKEKEEEEDPTKEVKDAVEEEEEAEETVGKKLPDTATPWYNMLLAGIALLLVSGGVLWRKLRFS